MNQFHIKPKLFVKKWIQEGSHFGLFWSLLLTVGCQMAPTKVREQPLQQTKVGTQIPQDFILVDARSANEYLIRHIPGSYNFPWQDFNQRKPRFIGLLDQDLFALARRLARYGIAPTSKVLVVGNGKNGGGEEGRVAWTLQYLGINQVEIASIELYNTQMTSNESEPERPAPIWKPEPQSGHLIEKKEFLEKLRPPRKALLVDVRREDEFLGKSPSVAGKFSVDLGAMNIPWTDFIDERGQVNWDLQRKLNEIGITPEKEIFLIDNNGVRSGLACFVLQKLGFKKARNFSGGYVQLMPENN